MSEGSNVKADGFLSTLAAALTKDTNASDLPKKKIAVSACLLGIPCRYDGRSCFDSSCQKLSEAFEIIPVCPECLAGLPTPRKPMEISDGRVITASGDDLTDQLMQGVREAVSLLKDQQAEGAVLMERSPSCGSELIYDGSFASRLVPGKGVFARELEKAEIPFVSKEILQGCVNEEVALKSNM